MNTLKIFGPPGTGKTSALVELLTGELERVSPERIAFLTFTRAARETVLSRVEKSTDELPYVRTIHAICYRQLGMTQSQVVHARDIHEFGKRLGVDLTGTTRGPWSIEEDESRGWARPRPADVLLQLNHVGRHREILLNEALKFADQEIEYRFARWFTTAYREWKYKDGLLDFTDLLTDYVKHGPELDVDVVFIDEAQDLSRLQWRVVDKLCRRAQRVYIAGDDDQAIFSWAGADAHQFIERFADEEIVLSKSYRLPRRIHAKAQEISGRIKTRRAKEFSPRDAEGQVLAAGYLDPKLLDGPSTFILYRNHHCGQTLARQLETLSIPYVGSMITHDPVQRALRAFKQFTLNQPATMKDARSLIGYTSKEWLKSDAKEKSSESRGSIASSDILLRRPKEEEWLEVLTRLPGRNYIARCVAFCGWDRTMKPTVELISIHQSKGREAHTVAIAPDLTRKTYDAWFTEPDDEHRVWYVAATRAKERLFILTAATDRSYVL